MSPVRYADTSVNGVGKKQQSVDNIFCWCKPFKKMLAKNALQRMPKFSGHRLFSTSRPFNFSAGPGCIDESVMEQAQKDFLNFGGSGMGLIEMSHRDAGGPVQECIIETSNLIREMLKVPDNYHVFFMHGGAHAQFAAVPLNLSRLNRNSSIKQVGGYVDCGHWSNRAKNEASKFIDTKIIAGGKDFDNYHSIPDVKDWEIEDKNKMSYVHICANETIHGLEFLYDPEINSNGNSNVPPLVGDFTSTLFSREMDVSKYGVIYASGGKNFGPPGVCVMIVRDDLICKGDIKQDKLQVPGILDWHEMISSTPIHSIWNTPVVFQIYMTKLTLTKYKNMCLENDGKRINLNKIGDWTKSRANKIYDIIDNSDGFYQNFVQKKDRSVMNVPFRIGKNIGEYDVELEKKFTQMAESEFNLLQLFGHPLFGGQRVTLYNPVPDAAVDKCAEFMQYFMEMHQKAL